MPRKSLSLIEEVIKQINNLSQKNAASINEQNKASQHANESIQKISQMSVSSSDSMMNNIQVTHELNKLSDELHQLTHRFKI